MKKGLLLLLSLLYFSGSFAQITNAFRVTYDQALFDLPANAIEGLTPNTYVFGGTNMNFLPIFGTVTQVDATGNLMWSKRLSDASLGFQLNDIKKDAAGSEYFACGGSESNDAVFVRIDAAGNLVIAKKFGITQADGAYFNRVIKTSDGGYVAVGYVTGYDPDGAGPEIDFVPINYNDVNGDPQTEVVGSPLIVKLNASGDHVWHKVFRYYNNATKAPATRIYNDASFRDIIETTDGYIAVGSYDVNDVLSNTNSDGDDATANDALVLKTDFTGNVTYHIQYDALNFSATQQSKYLNAINKTAAGVPIAAGQDNGREWIIKFNGPGAFTSVFSRLFTYSTFFGTPDPVEISNIYEIPGGTGDLTTMGMYIKPLSFVFSNSVHRINSTATTNVFAKYYTFSLATILPQGSLTADNSYIMASTVMGAGSFDYHVIKTDPNGDTPLAGCAPTAFTPTAAAGVTTTATPHFNAFTGTVEPQALSVIVTNITPTSTVQCSFVACTPPTAPVAAVASQPTCSTSTGSVTLTGLPTTGTWTVTGTPSGTATGNTSTTTISGLAPGNYTFTVDLGGCPSVASNQVTINAAPTVPTAPVIGTITQPTCASSTGSVALSGLPAGAWTITASPGGATISGSGTTGNFTGLAPGTYTFTVNGSSGSTNLFSEDFETGAAGWNLNVPTGPEGADANYFEVDDDEGGVAPLGCGVANNANETLHITSVFNPAGGAAYDAGGLCGFLFCPQSNRRAESPAISSIGQSGLTLNFNYIAKGDIPNDQATVWYNDGTGWYQLGAALNSTICGGGQGQWTAYSSALPASCNNIANLKVAIRWVNNDDGAGTDPSVAINDVTVSAALIGCSSLASASVTINPVPTAPTAPIIGTVTQPTCATPTGTINLSGLPASGTWTITGSPSGTATGTGTTTSITGLAPGSYTFTVTQTGCTSSASTSTTINPVPSTPTAPINGTVTQPTCATPTGSINLSGLPTSGTWTITGTPSGTLTGTGSTSSMTGLTPGNYTFTVEQAGCTSPASTSVTINAAPNVPTAPVIGTITQPTCASSTGSINLSGLPASGTWTITGSPSGSATGTGTTGSITGLAPGSYTFTVTNAAGCTSTASTSATVDPVPTTPTPPIIGTVTQPTCATPTGTINLSGLPASGTWTITGSPSGTATGTGTTTSITGLAPGSYTFTVTQTGCTSSASTSTTINPVPSTPTAPINGTVTQPTCATATGSIALSGLPAVGTWTVTGTPSGSATGTGTTTTITGLTPGNYTFTVEQAGCTSPASTSVTINAAPTVPTAPVIGTITQPTCASSTGSINLSGLPASGTWTVTGSPSGTATGTGTTGSITGLAPGSYTFTVTNAAGCTSTASTSATVDPVPTTPTPPIIGTVTQPTCATPTGTINLSGLPASGTWTITGSPSGTATGTGTTTSITGLAPGSYTFTVTQTGCTSSASTSTTINPVPSTPTAPINGTVTQPTCATPTGSINLSGLPTSGTWTITGTPSGTLTGTGSTSSMTGLTPGNYTFTVEQAGCTSPASTSITINAAPGAPALASVGTVTQPNCATPTGSIQITAPLGAQYTYSIDGTTFSASTTISGLAPGNYNITVLDNGTGCSSITTSAVTINPVAGAPVITLVGSQNVSCNSDDDGEIEISLAGGQLPYTIVWTPNVGSTTTVSNLTAGSYSVTVTDNLGCSSTQSFTVSEPDALEVNGIATDVICGSTDGTISTNVTGGTGPFTYAWTPNGEITDGLTSLFAGNYSVTVTDDNGCAATQNFVIANTGTLAIDVTPGYSEIDPGQSVDLVATGGTTYTWATSTSLSCTNCANPTASPSSNTVYYVTATAPNGCTGGDSAVVVIKMPCGELFVPTIFSPDATGPAANNALCVFGSPACIEEFLFQVYDRWGEKVFETDDITECWDGNLKGKPMNSGIFVYRLHAKISSQVEAIDISGNTTLVR
ncbi:MAG: gliding motility-associated C-terminal domain-containing protein [Bacteroidota bacterium]